MKHTSGPWRVVLKENAIGPYVFSIGNFQIAVVGPALIRFGDGAVQRMNSDEAHANARLIAAAPELLEALEALCPPMPPADASCHAGIVPQSECAHCKRIALARAAISSARGEQQ